MDLLLLLLLGRFQLHVTDDAQKIGNQRVGKRVATVFLQDLLVKLECGMFFSQVYYELGKVVVVDAQMVL